MALLLAACQSSSLPSTTISGANAVAKTTIICPGAAAEKQAIIAFFDAHEGDVIEFCEGKFDFNNGLVMTGKKGITIKGAG